MILRLVQFSVPIFFLNDGKIHPLKGVGLPLPPTIMVWWKTTLS